MELLTTNRQRKAHCPVPPPPELVKGKGSAAEAELQILHSRDSKHKVYNVVFKNTTRVHALLIWRNHCGKEVAYNEIKPGQHSIMGTFSTHPWTAKVHALPAGAAELEGLRKGARLVIGPAGGAPRMVAFADRPCEIVISEPPVLEWSLETHKYWPEAFKETVRELLRAHHVVARRAAAGQQLALDPPPMAPRDQGVGAVSGRKDRKLKSADRTLKRALRLLFGGCCGSNDAVRGTDDSNPTVDPNFMVALLDAIPNHLLIHIIAGMAPTVRQCITHGAPSGHPDIQPALLPWDPAAEPDRKCRVCGKCHGKGEA